MFRKVGVFENIPVYESPLFKNGHGLTIPQIGMITFPGAYSQSLDLPLIKHEFGHILQYRKLNNFGFYVKVGFPSLWSAVKASSLQNYFHQSHPVEIEANRLAFNYFNRPIDWDVKRFPIT